MMFAWIPPDIGIYKAHADSAYALRRKMHLKKETQEIYPYRASFMHHMCSSA